MVKVNDIVVIVDNDAIPSSFLGCYGRVTEVIAPKVLVELNAKIPEHKHGSLSHTALITDVQKVGEMIV